MNLGRLFYKSNVSDKMLLVYIVANGTETVAVLQGSDEHKLYGYKWFTSATDADISLTLAREQDDKGDTTPVCIVYVCCNRIYVCHILY